MSAFGGPGGGQITQKPIPPQRGSFPLDHDGECKHVMKTYLSCIQKVKGMNDEACRDLAKSYLACRMDRNLMARDDFKNLGFKDAKDDKSSKGETPKAGGGEAGAKGELRW